MKMSKMFGKRLKEKPANVVLKSNELLIRGGYIRPVSNGIFSTMLPGKKILRNIENIVRNEMDSIDGQEVEMPLMQPKELWEESGRYQAINHELVKFNDRNDHEMVLAMTHEEAAVALARTEANSYKDFPFTIYQFAKKIRDEARPRGGLIRVKEFTMKDAYSFHTNQKDLENYYDKCLLSYSKIFAKSGIPEVVSIKSDNGMMGGSISHEYMLLAPAGEDTIITCSHCDYKANKEVAESEISAISNEEDEKGLEEVETPNIKTVQDVAVFFNEDISKIAKTVIYNPINEEDKAIVVMTRGDIEINENKLAKIIGGTPELANDELIINANMIPGFSSAYNIENCKVLIDNSLKDEMNLITGGNKEDIHIKNFNVERDLSNFEFVDTAFVKDGEKCVDCGSELSLQRGIEVGNIFQLGDKYTKNMGMKYIDEDGNEKTPIMGCYGIGIGRLMASILEVQNDDRGPIWPISVAPWKVSITSLYQKDNKEIIDENSREIYENLLNDGIDVIWDDRNTRAGEKFADMDLLGIPLQLIVSKKNLENNLIEWKERGSDNKGVVSINEIYTFINSFIKSKEMEIDNSVQEIEDNFISSNEKKTNFNFGIAEKILERKQRD